MTVVDDGVASEREPWVRRRQPPSRSLVHRVVRAGLVGGVCVYGAELEYSIQIARASGDTAGGGAELAGMLVLGLAVIGSATLLLGVLPTRIRAALATVLLAVPAAIGVLWLMNLHLGISVAAVRFLRSALLDALAAAAVFACAACLTQRFVSRGEPGPSAAGGVAGPVRRAGGVARASAAARWSAATALVGLLAGAGMTYRWVGTEAQAPDPGPPVHVSAGCARLQLAWAGGAIPADFRPIRVVQCALRRPAGSAPGSTALELTQSTGTGDLAAVLAAIQARARGHQHWNGSCGGAVGASDLVFVDASGRALLAALPYGATSCLKAPHDLQDALGHLAWSPTTIVA